MAELTVRRDLPAGAPPRYFRRDGAIVVQLAEDADNFTERRIIREAQRAFRVRRRGLPMMLPIPVGTARVRHLIRDHPTTTGAVTSVLALGIAAGAMYGTSQLGDDNSKHRRRPPTAAGPATTPGPSTAAPTPSRRTGPTVHPGEPSGPARPNPRTVPVDDQPATVRPSTTPGGTGGAPSTSKPPAGTPPATPPAVAPPPSSPPDDGGDFCLLHLAALGILDVSLCL